MKKEEIRSNREIRAFEVFVLDETGTQLGVMKTRDALRIAEERGLDLVEVSPSTKPPVCKILDYGKYRYEMEKKSREAKKNQTVTKLKEVRMQVKVDVGDLNTKARFIKEFLDEKNKVKVSVRFRGREMQHPEIGKEVLSKVLVRLDEIEALYTVERQPIMEGRMMSMLLSPQKSQGKKPQKEQQTKEKTTEDGATEA